MIQASNCGRTEIFLPFRSLGRATQNEQGLKVGVDEGCVFSLLVNRGREKLSGILSNAFSVQLFCDFPIFVMNIKLCSEERTQKVLGIQCIFLLRLMV